MRIMSGSSRADCGGFGRPLVGRHVSCMSNFERILCTCLAATFYTYTICKYVRSYIVFLYTSSIDEFENKLKL